MAHKTLITRRGIPLLAGVGLALLLATAVQSSQKPKSQDQTRQGQSQTDQAGGQADQDLVRHGKYLVHHVAMCIQCHTPRDRDGHLIESQLLEGGTIPFKRPYPNFDWALQPPHLAGLPGGWSKESLAHFLQTGETPTGHPPDPPMPPFRMNERDAKAVAAYLQSMTANR